MDNAYIQKNVLPALTEALSAMATQSPDDKVEFIGRYLLSYVDRRALKKTIEKDTTEVEAKLAIYLKQEKAKNAELEEKNAPTVFITTQYERLLDAIPTKATKQEALNSVVEFLENIMHIPSAYIAFKAPVGDSEVLNYYAAGPNSQTTLGKKLPKPVIDEGAEEVPERLGASFEAFKVPEVPEEEAAEEAAEGEEGAAPVKKGPPPLSNLIVPNVMRDKRVKFYGIPKLGSFVACPFGYSSYEHDAVSVFTPPDGENSGGYSLAPKEQQFIIAFDSVGKYRQFSSQEIERVVALGNKLIELFQKLEVKTSEKHLQFLQSDVLKAFNDAVTEFAGKIPGEEAAAMEALAAEAAAAAAAATAAAGEGAEPPAVPEGAEQLKAKKDAAALVSVWGRTLAGGAVGSQLKALQSFVLPLPLPCLKVLYAVGLLLNEPAANLQDVCGDPSWDVIKQNFLGNLPEKLLAYDSQAVLTLSSKSNAFAAVKAYLESNNLADASLYPPFLTFFPNALLPWLQKAIAAREAAFTYSNEVDKKPLEL